MYEVCMALLLYSGMYTWMHSRENYAAGALTGWYDSALASLLPLCFMRQPVCIAPVGMLSVVCSN